MSYPTTITIMWKDQIASVAQFDGTRAKIQIIDPVGSHHLFPKEELDAYLFLRILEQRCPSRHRPDIDKILNHYQRVFRIKRFVYGDIVKCRYISAFSNLI